MAETNEKLISELIRDGYLKTPRLVEAFNRIDRKNFIPKELISEAYGNYPLPIGYGQTISQPLTVAFMLELLEPKPGEKILDIGAGSGWTTALLAYIVSKPQASAERTRTDAEKNLRSSASSQRESAGRVVAIERIHELKEMAEKNVTKYSFIEKGIAKVILGDGSMGYSEWAPYDKIIAAAAAEKIPDTWGKQLKVGGRIVAPVGNSILTLDKISENKFKTKEYFGFSFVPLVKD